jgi:NADH-quinone oxidoreductase subunit M
MLLGFAAVFAAAGTLDFEALARLAADGSLGARLAALGGIWPRVVFAGVFLGVAVKVPLYPFHTWLPPAYAQAPTGVAMFLTAVMSKMGVYGFLRILWPLFPAPLHAAAGYLLCLALAGAVLGAFAAMRQTDLKRMLAYSSLNHVSYCLLALFAVAAAAPGAAAPAKTDALAGTLLQMFNHGITAAALFLCVGILESRGGGKRGLDSFGGVRSAAPVFAGLCGIAMFSSLGLPGLNGFVGEFLIFRGVFGLVPWAAALACLGLLATAMFLLTFWQRVFHGEFRAPSPARGFADLTGTELCALVPLVALMILFGVLPHLLTGLFNPLVAAWAGQLSAP